jgi:DNA repair protein RadC
VARRKIKDLPLEDRPRERLLVEGSETLSDVELLAILIGSGTQGKSALDIAQELFDRFGGYRGIAGRSIAELMEIQGMGEAKAAVVAAAYEIATRIVEMVLEDLDSRAWRFRNV